MPTPKGLKQEKNLECPECGKLCAPMGLINHIRLKHKIQVVKREVEFQKNNQAMLQNMFPLKQRLTCQPYHSNLKNLSASEIKRIQDEIVARGNYKDINGNVMELLGGQKDDEENIKRLIFINKLKYLVEIWDAEIDLNEQVQAKQIL